MKNAAKNLVLSFAVGLLAAGTALAQTSGRINYEATQRVDLSQMRIVINGQAIKPGSPDFPTDIPETRSFGLNLTFAGTAAKEEREGGGMTMRTVSMNGNGEGPASAPKVTNFARPFEEATYLDLANRTTTTVLTVKKDNSPTTYRSDAPIAPPANWTVTTQTKKIAGYTCRKATVPYKKETYTVWFTTDLPFTYSPVRDLTPEKGVVLALESDQEQYRAAKVELKAVPEAEVKPSATAQKVTPAELKEMREKAMADFRQRMMEGSNFRN
ncbi:GLPGLI family protein [Hymenobacter sp. BT770]|uniref:GLPGLI family protein n=1 Tax=Hymenobacter sp. BT770 TaxID=2886942 RepID=UPI001D0FCFEC|nr:GLPGLI family protein [Hymenobacter sp. BT770]MCC3153936.1 GLPGLI family protein [Hymenobacter sp. BT770]MDO3416134.1 GLPGLI family protein [Hymenobacter sp. BT770]